MNLLLIDATSAKIEFAVYKDKEEFIRHTLNESENADSLIFNIYKICSEKDFALIDLDYVSISNGPGSFTGLRISSAIAKAICLASDAKLIEVNSLDVLANKADTQKVIIPLIYSNMRTNEFYYSKFRKDNGFNRLDEYSTALIGDILNEEDFFISNNNIEDFAKGVFHSESSNIDSLYQLTENYVSQNKFSDYNTSEPNYMKEFVPLKSQKKLL